MMAPGAIVGAYGKLPWTGDFVRRRLRPDTIAALDIWLQNRLLGSEKAWRTSDVTPCCFAAAPGVFGATSLTGLISPSCDNVGRIFPLVFGVETPSHGHIEINLAWFERASVALQRAREGGSLDRFLADLQGSLTESPQVAVLSVPQARSVWWTPGDLGEARDVVGQPDVETFALLTQSWRNDPGDLFTPPPALT